MEYLKFCPECGQEYDSGKQVCPKDGRRLLDRDILPSGTLVEGRFRVEEPLGSGGMAHVYLVTDQVKGKRGVLKILRRELQNDEVLLKRFMIEASIARGLDHPAIVRIEEIGETDDGRPYLFMEYVPGQTLRQLLDKEGPFSVRRSLHLLEQVCAGLREAHQKGVIHRDIKPDNLLVYRDDRNVERVKILDFGLSKVLEETGLAVSVHSMTTSGSFVGTPFYASPEQARGIKGRDLDERTDIYALGVVLYEMIVGRVPFYGNSVLDVLWMHIREPVPHPREVRPGCQIPTTVWNLLQKALAKRPQDRFRTAEEMRQAIRHALSELARMRTLQDSDSSSTTSALHFPSDSPTVDVSRFDRVRESPHEAETIFVSRELDGVSPPVSTPGKQPEDFSEPSPGLSYEKATDIGVERGLRGLVKKWFRKQRPSFIETVRTLDGHVRAVFAIEFSPDGRWLVTAGQDRRILIWRLRDGQIVRDIANHADTVSALVWYSGQNILVSGSWDRSIRGWEVPTGEEVFCIEGMKSWVTSLACHPHKPLLLVGEQDGNVSVWDLKRVRCIEKKQFHEGDVYAIAYIPGLDAFATVGGDQIVRVLMQSARGSYQVSRLLKGHGSAVTAASVDTKGRWIASGDEDGWVILCDIQRWSEYRRIRAHEGMIRGLAWWGDGRHLISTGLDGVVRIWKIFTGEQVGESGFLKKENVLCLRVDMGRRIMAVGMSSGRVYLYGLRLL